jgi:hypothetical protein
MPLLDRTDFRDWLTRFEQRHAILHGERKPEAGVCDGCGARIVEPVSPVGLCLVCLAETYGLERGKSADRVAGMLEAALATAGDLPPADVRDAIEEVLERYEGDEPPDAG